MSDATVDPGEYLDQYLAEKRTAIDQAIQNVLSRYPQPLGEMMIYAAEGGKRLRGAVVLAVSGYLSGIPAFTPASPLPFPARKPEAEKEGSRAVQFPSGVPCVISNGADTKGSNQGKGELVGTAADDLSEDALDLAVAVELVHAYSLVHDDLPCMDNDDFRRGKPTVHRKFGEAMAVLAGDALLTAAFEVGLGGASLPPERRNKRARACAELSRGAGAAGMVAGQVFDMEAKGKRLGPQAVKRIYLLKTGALFESAARIGGILAGVDDRSLDSLGAWGREFGYAFQIADDIEDAQAISSTEDDTLVAETSVQDAAREAVLALTRSLEHLSCFERPGQTWFLPELSRFYLNRLNTI
ncbi:MAG: polyprenyl synthetase family protein [Firmicutes bacterium]|nr:polyprenyl synthetase family protein [Candidatus Fermentithermobacillaceae bacterium]